jgi:hypothetical protein
MKQKDITKIGYRLNDFFMVNKLIKEERELLENFLSFYSELDFSGQERANEMIGKLYKTTEGWKKSTGKSTPKWFPRDEIGHSIADHCERFNLNGKDSLVCHPYGVTLSAAEELNTICKKHNITYTIDGESNYFLGVTPRIIFTKTPCA